VSLFKHGSALKREFNPKGGQCFSRRPGPIPRQPRPFVRPPAPAFCPPVPALGQPLCIEEAAELIGCSPWTVRQKLMPMGLPHFRSAASGKLIFYQDQVIRWIESKTKGG